MTLGMLFFIFFYQAFKCSWGCSYSMGNWASIFWNAKGNL